MTSLIWLCVCFKNTVSPPYAPAREKVINHVAVRFFFCNIIKSVICFGCMEHKTMNKYAF